MNIILRNIDIKDAHKIAKWKSDPVLAEQIMSSFKDTHVKNAENWIIKNTEDQFQQLKGIYLKENSSLELLGITRLMFIDFNSLNAELGIYIGDSTYQNAGIGKKALCLTLENGFNQLHLSKIYLKVSTINIRAVGLYKKFNFKAEGYLREHFLKNGKFEDVIYMALFKEDFI
jgi:RimJ/RimL family protein N-acetyltransferase